MANCTQMKKGQVYVCADCGLELQVVKECTACEPSDTECGEDCAISCCGKELELKS